jgi:hypothetical protein
VSGRGKVFISTVQEWIGTAHSLLYKGLCCANLLLSPSRGSFLVGKD